MKRGQFNFVWMFAIIAGAAILFLAIFGLSKFIDTKKHETDTKAAKSISILTDPLEAGFSEGSSGNIIFKKEARIINTCSNSDGEFGKSGISVATKSDIGKKWTKEGEEISVHNKYIFSSNGGVGKKHYGFSKPFKFPYKVADLIFLTPRNYCFINAPKSISKEISGLNLPNINTENCTFLNPVRVCFGNGEKCDILVRESSEIGTVSKNGKKMKYAGRSLMYAAIFSDKEIYDCNVKRLMYRAGKIAEELGEKADLMDARGCNTKLNAKIKAWKSQLTNASADNLAGLYKNSKSLEKEKEFERCELWQ